MSFGFGRQTEREKRPSKSHFDFEVSRGSGEQVWITQANGNRFCRLANGQWFDATTLSMGGEGDFVTDPQGIAFLEDLMRSAEQGGTVIFYPKVSNAS